jgi:integrase
MREGISTSSSFRPTEQLRSLLDAAGSRRALLSTLAGAGLRNGETCALNWGDIGLASGTLTVREAKTDAGVRASICLLRCAKN